MSKEGFKDIDLAGTDPNVEQFAPTDAQPIRQHARMAGDPIRKVAGGYKWGGHGHVYPTREGAVKQAQAAYAHGYKGK